MSALRGWSGLRLTWRTQSFRWLQSIGDFTFLKNQAEAALFLEQHWCTPERPQCIPAIQHHFIPMHVMVMERFMVPTDICNHQFAACNPDWMTHGPHPTHPHPTHPPM